ncbi:GSCFA domain-containing protein [Sphingobium sp. HBC34]|uniref:GSCFA domain-containing protein n=1 Tax=Sphingobium cyanobacteriorum TaxID=3063954 RepID=A0ABT8ZHV9_9SPHN|nr:GSCFA domain-containing protein [Sphingobium sp. HBC34]MDO7833796.1 GSCFA domain-containing protein [Sphingobium sp. HBC34]
MAKSEMMVVDLDGVEKKVSGSFWRGADTRFLPLEAGMQLPTALAQHVLSGWMPKAPFINEDTTIVAFGSCFAHHISGYLNNLGYDVATQKKGKAYITEMGDGIVNSYAIRQQFEWGWEGRVPEIPLWHGYKAEDFGYEEDVRIATRELFDKADVFIITLGLSEIWYDEPTGEVFWRAVPRAQFDPGRHKFRVATVEENKDNLRSVYKLIRKHRPDASIIFTVSPVTLSATFRPIGPFTANAVSKASLRCAVDEVILEYKDDDNFYYYPAYEVVLNCFHYPFVDDLRHPQKHVLDVNMIAFERYFCCTGLTDDDVGLAYLNALAADRATATLTLDEQEQINVQLRALQETNRPASVRREKAQEARQALAEARLQEKAAREADRDRRIAERNERIAARERELAARKDKMQSREG